MPTTTPEHDKRITEMIFGKIYPLYLNRLVKNGRLARGRKMEKILRGG